MEINESRTENNDRIDLVMERGRGDLPGDADAKVRGDLHGITLERLGQLQGDIACKAAMVPVRRRIKRDVSNGGKRGTAEDLIDGRPYKGLQLIPEVCEHKIEGIFLLPSDGNSFLPEMVKPVEFAGIFLEDMDHDIAHIQKDPSPVRAFRLGSRSIGRRERKSPGP